MVVRVVPRRRRRRRGRAQECLGRRRSCCRCRGRRVRGHHGRLRRGLLPHRGRRGGGGGGRMLVLRARVSGVRLVALLLLLAGK
jgi:hypothetical protein